MNPNELNARVAVEVMGWETWNVAAPFDCEFPHAITSCEGVLLGTLDGGHPKYKRWSPSTDLNAAFEVWSKLKHRQPLLRTLENGEYLCAMLASDDEQDNDYTFEEDGTQVVTRRHVKATHANPATAICLAALQAVGKETNRE